MASREVSSSASPSALANRPLPPAFHSIQDVLNKQGVAIGSLVNVVGVVRDARLPMQTRKDWKCSMTIFDKSRDDENIGIVMDVFGPEKEMPNLASGDVVLIKSAKVQNYRGEIRLLSNVRTDVYVYSASAIPMPPKSAKDALKPRTGLKANQPTDKENEYVSWMYHAVDKGTLPSAAEFEEQANRSLNIKEKFSLLKDVRDGGFYDLIVDVIKDPYDLLDKVSMWVTDYTENDRFFRYTWDASTAGTGRDGDPFGYTSAFQSPKNTAWPGPFGKRCLQLTCWEPHAGYLRSQVRAGKWISLRNVQIKYGRNGGHLEGFLREDRMYSSRLGIDILELTEDSDKRLKDAIRRKHDYVKKMKQQQEEFRDDKGSNAKGTKQKGKGEPPVTLNSKQKRKLNRARVKQKIEQQQVQQAELLGLNKQVICESEDQPVSSLDRILDGVSWKRAGANGEELVALPFTNIKFRANVRVVDFRPRRLEDFAAWRRETEFDVLSDYDGGSESESDGQGGTLGNFAAPKIWEWRFALELEDASPKAKSEKPERLWALVDNIETQQLINMDASDLHADPDQLSLLREQLFKLWGNLEECKRPEYEAHLESIRRANALEPPPDSSDNEAEPGGSKHTDGGRPLAKVSNKPFTCCLQQYGLEITEADPTKCDAGEGKRYQRFFKLFGTRIT
ncbi:hypothetical protein PG984_004263 [Apiospora sp. TS-2023a]